MSDGTTITTDCCPECGSDVDWGTSSWCPSCGFYPAIDFRNQQDGPLTEEEVIYEHWWEVVPGWLWSLLAGVCLIVIVSGCVRVLFADNPIRTWWTIGQMIGGGVTLCTVHLMAYLYSASRTDRFGPGDMVVQPLAVWQPVLRNLPESSNLVCWGAFGLTAVLTSYLIVDGFSYSDFVQKRASTWAEQHLQQKREEEQKQKCRTTFAVAIRTASTIARVQQASCGGMPVPDTLEEAVSQITGDALEDEQPSGGASSASQVAGNVPKSIRRDSLPATKPRPAGNGPAGNKDGASQSTVEAVETPVLEVECLILGYTTNTTGEIRSLLLAAAPDLRFLRFVGKLPVDQVAPEVLDELLVKFEEIPAPRPMVRCPYGGRWVRPELFCIATYKGWTADGRLSNAEVVRLMNTEAQ